MTHKYAVRTDNAYVEGANFDIQLYGVISTWAELTEQS